MSPTARCRSCAGTHLTTFLDLGTVPLADRFVDPGRLNEQEPAFALQVAFCSDCGLVQILETVAPEVLFCDDYPYYSSVSPALLEHSRANVHGLIDRFGLNADSLVVELASNDGYLLQYYTQRGIPVLGIDPAEGPAQAARKKGIPTLVTFFTRELAERLRRDGRQADVIHANNVLAHVADTNGFVAGIAMLLKDTGSAVIEVPYLVDLIDHDEFDTIYHEHLCYFSVTAIVNLVKRHGLTLNDLERLTIHGGSLRLFISKRGGLSQTVQELLAREHRAGIDTERYYRDFARRVSAVAGGVRTYVQSLKSAGKHIAAYGAAAKGTTFINFTGIGPALIDFVVDRNVHKHGKYMPGLHIPILPVERLMLDKPDYVLLLAWNFVDEIVEQQREYISAGGCFIVPLPRLTVISSSGRSPAVPAVGATAPRTAQTAAAT